MHPALAINPTATGAARPTPFQCKRHSEVTTLK
jgi:hypothetical protein